MQLPWACRVSMQKKWFTWNDWITWLTLLRLSTMPSVNAWLRLNNYGLLLQFSEWTDARKTTLNPEFQEFEDLATRNESVHTSSEWISKLRQAKWSVKIEVRSLKCLCYSNSSQDIQYLKNWSLLRKNAAQLEKWLSCRLLEEVTTCQ